MVYYEKLTGERLPIIKNAVNVESNKKATRCPFLESVEQLGESVVGDCISAERSKLLPFVKSNVNGVISTFLQVNFKIKPEVVTQ